MTTDTVVDRVEIMAGYYWVDWDPDQPERLVCKLHANLENGVVVAVLAFYTPDCGDEGASAPTVSIYTDGRATDDGADVDYPTLLALAEADPAVWALFSGTAMPPPRACGPFAVADGGQYEIVL